MNRTIPPRFLDEWVYVFGIMQDHLQRGNGPPVDDFDLDAFEDCFSLLRDRVLTGQLNRTSPEVYQIGFAIRGKGFRPTYEQIIAIVKDKLKIVDPVEVPGHIAAERTVYKKPQPLQIEGSNTARDRARQKMNELIARNGMDGSKPSHGPEVWRPAYPRPDPLENVPAELHPALIEAAIQELLKTGKSRHPNHIRTVAGKIYRDSLRKPPPPQHEEDAEIFDTPVLVMA